MDGGSGVEILLSCKRCVRKCEIPESCSEEVGIHHISSELLIRLEFRGCSL
jgi:hypothetical protein